MKKNNLITIGLLLFLSTILSSCAAISGIFNAGMGFGIFIVIAIIVVIVIIAMKARGRKS